MRIRWFGQSAFLLSGSVRVAIDPFGGVSARAAERDLRVRARRAAALSLRRLRAGGAAPPDAFLAACEGDVREVDGSEAELEGLLGNGVRRVIGLLTAPT
jgi:hypothetical protein